VSEFRQHFGLSVALATPFRPNGDIDQERLTKHAEACLQQGCDSVTVFGTTGEGASIGHRERQSVLDAMAAAGIKDSRLVVGISSTSVEDVVADVQAAQACGCRGILLPPPFYFKSVSDDGVVAWYSAVFERLGDQARDIILYNIPQLTGVALSIDLISRLRAAFPGVVTGVKDSSCDWSHTEPLLAAHRDIAVLVGDERDLAAAVRLGGQGAICGMANIYPAEMRVMAWDGKDNSHICDLIDLINDYPIVPAIKALMAHRSGDADWLRVRAPLDELNEDEVARLGQGVDRLASGRAA
jgi:4-hydroxy-tetrahydrodipicolinate synthase